MAAMTCAILLTVCDHLSSIRPASNGAAEGCRVDGTNRGGHVDLHLGHFPGTHSDYSGRKIRVTPHLF